MTEQRAWSFKGQWIKFEISSGNIKQSAGNLSTTNVCKSLE